MTYHILPFYVGIKMYDIPYSNLLYGGKKCSKHHILIFYAQVKFNKTPYSNLLCEAKRGCHGRDRIVVGFTPIYAISTYHH